MYRAQQPSKPPQGLTLPKTTVLTPQRATVVDASTATPVTPKRVTHRAYKPRARHCKNCGEVFTPKSKLARYCSDNCRKALWKRKQGKRKIAKPHETGFELIVCAGCGHPFFGNKGQKHCKASCKTAAWRIRRTAAITVLAFDLSITEDKAADAIEVGGMRKITAYLSARGYNYDATTKAWLVPLVS